MSPPYPELSVPASNIRFPLPTLTISGIHLPPSSTFPKCFSPAISRFVNTRSAPADRPQRVAAVGVEEQVLDAQHAPAHVAHRAHLRVPRRRCRDWSLKYTASTLVRRDAT
eukprot:5985938-Pleurochrysis_carterae.AAC.1